MWVLFALGLAIAVPYLWHPIVLEVRDRRHNKAHKRAQAEVAALEALYELEAYEHS